MGDSVTPAGLRNPTRYIPQLESLRGWAILLVIAFHTLAFFAAMAPEAYLRTRRCGFDFLEQVIPE